MPKLELNNANVLEKELTVVNIREHIEDTLEIIDSWLDEAQGEIYSGKQTEMYLVIKIT